VAITTYESKDISDTSESWSLASHEYKIHITVTGSALTVTLHLGCYVTVTPESPIVTA